MNFHFVSFAYLFQNIDPRGKSATKFVPGKRREDLVEKDQVKNSDNDAEEADGFSFINSLGQDIEELIAVKQQVEDLQSKLLEKDELLKAAEDAKNQLNLLQVHYDALKQQAAERDSVVQSTELDLTDAKVLTIISLLT